MKQINPLYVMALLVLALIFVMVKLNDATATKNEVLTELGTTQKMAKRITSLKRTWDRPKASKKSLVQLLKSPPLKNANITKKTARGSITIKATALNTHEMGYLMSKLLNGSYTIKSYHLKRLSEEKASLKMELSL